MSKKSKDAASTRKPRKVKRPKKKCCVSQPRCKRCPLRMLAEGTLPAGYAVKHRKLVEAKLPKKDKQGKKAKKDKRSKQAAKLGITTDIDRRAA